VFLMSHATSVPASYRVRAILTDPSAPFVLFTGLLVAAAVLPSTWLVWVGFAGLAGYSLSGSA
jgi:hypothetical protein